MKILLLHALLFTCFSSFAETYTTMSNGHWGDELSVWSLDGENPCLCTPSNSFSGDTILINHDLSFSSDFIIYGLSLLTINSDATLSATASGGNKYDITTLSGSVIVYGIVSVGKFEVRQGTTLEIIGGKMFAEERLIVGGTMIVDNTQIIQN